MILMMYVDNNLVKTNCDELVEEFEAKVCEHGQIICRLTKYLELSVPIKRLTLILCSTINV
jgi:hypothetical protein